MKLKAHKISLASSRVLPKKKILTLSLLLLSKFSSWLTNEYKIFSKALKTAKDLAKMSKNFKIIRENTIQVTPMFVVESADKQESCGLGRVELIVDNNGEVIPVEDSMFESQAEILKAK